MIVGGPATRLQLTSRPLSPFHSFSAWLLSRRASSYRPAGESEATPGHVSAIGSRHGHMHSTQSAAECHSRLEAKNWTTEHMLHSRQRLGNGESVATRLNAKEEARARIKRATLVDWAQCLPTVAIRFISCWHHCHSQSAIRV